MVQLPNRPMISRQLRYLTNSTLRRFYAGYMPISTSNLGLTEAATAWGVNLKHIARLHRRAADMA
jgi:hypothetical protein